METLPAAVWMVFCLLTSSSPGQALASAGAWALHPVSPISGIRPSGIHPNRSPGSGRVPRTESFLLTPCPAAAALPSWEVTDSRGCSPTLWRESSCFLLHFILSSLVIQTWTFGHLPVSLLASWLHHSQFWISIYLIGTAEFVFIQLGTLGEPLALVCSLRLCLQQLIRKARMIII